MLDEIINYVQSLQRQVEVKKKCYCQYYCFLINSFQFLSMKLATVNPQLDFNLEGFVSKDVW